MKSVIRHRLENGFGDEAKSTLRSYEQFAEDLERRRPIDKPLHVVAGGVLDAVLPFDFRNQLRVRLDRALNLQEPRSQGCLGLNELTLGSIDMRS